MATLLNTSRFINSSLIKTRSGRDTFGLVDGFDTLRNITGDNVTFYTADSSDVGRPDKLAAKFYGDPHLEWIIIFANRPKNPLNWPSAGDTIKIPNNSFVRSLF